jgi:membrane protein
MWVYLSWAILLFGSEVTYAYQNEKTFTMERFADNASFAYRAALGLRAMIDMGRRFQKSLPTLQVEAAALEWNVPSRLIIETLEQLEDSGFITECATEQVSYQPARPLDQITAGDILRSLHERGEDPSRFLHDDAYRSVFDEYLYPSEGIHATTIEELIHRVHVFPKAPEAADAG